MTSQYERLGCLDTTPTSFKYMKNHIRDRLNRESCIAYEDIENTVKQIIELPFLGSRKGSLKLVHDEKAYIGSTTYKEIKSQLKMAVAQELHERREQSELQKAHYKRYREKERPFTKKEPIKKHQIWAIDFLNILLFGIYFHICVVYDIFSQSYLALEASIFATSDVAEQALNNACKYSDHIPEDCLLSDNGPQFKCYSFEEIKKRLRIKSQYIPRGQPWYNGALESGNRDLRKVIYTIAFYDLCKNRKLSKTEIDENDMYYFLQKCCQKTIAVLNNSIVRLKFRTTPIAVLNDQVKEHQHKRIRFIEKKKLERKKRMAQLKFNGGSKRKRIEDKVKAAWKKLSKEQTTEKLFAFRELIHNRYKVIMI